MTIRSSAGAGAGGNSSSSSTTTTTTTGGTSSKNRGPTRSHAPTRTMTTTTTTQAVQQLRTWLATHSAVATALTVALLIIAAYRPALRGPPVYDDESVLTHPVVVGQAPAGHVWTTDFWGLALDNPESHKSWRPLTLLLLRGLYVVAGETDVQPDAAPSTAMPFALLSPLLHKVNLVCHWVVCLLLLRILHLLSVPRKLASAVVLVFAVNPVHTEVVANMTGFADLVCAVFMLAALVVYLEPELSMVNRLAAALPLIAAALLAKEHGITIVGVFVAVSLVGRRQSNWGEAAAWTVMGTLLAVARLAAVGWTAPIFPEHQNFIPYIADRWQRAATIVIVLVKHLTWLVLPLYHCHDWSMGSIPPVTVLTDTRLLYSIVFLVVATAAAYIAFRTWRASAAGIVLVAGVALIVFPLVPSSHILLHIGYVAAERCLYVPSVGLAMMVCLAFMHWDKPHARVRWSWGWVLVLLAVFMMQTSVRSAQWADQEALTQADVQVNPLNAKLWYHMGLAAQRHQDHAAAHQHLRKSASLWPCYTDAVFALAEDLRRFNIMEMDLYRNILQCPYARHDRDKARLYGAANMRLGEDALQRNDTSAANAYFEQAWSFFSLNPLSIRAMGLSLPKTNLRALAPRYLRATLELNPNDTEVTLALANVQWAMDELDAAEETLTAFMTRVGPHKDALMLMGQVYQSRWDQKQRSAASSSEAAGSYLIRPHDVMIWFQRAQELSPPGDMSAVLEMAIFLHLKVGDTSRALQLYDTVLSVAPNEVVALINSGAILMDQSNLFKAEARFKQAVALQPNNEPATENLRRVQMRLAQ